MKLTKLGDYAVRGVVHLATMENGKTATLNEISSAENIPSSFFAKVMQSLARAGLVNAHRGIKGGYSLAKNADEITVRAIVEAVEGPILLNRCLGGKNDCDRDYFCGTHPVWREAQKALFKVLDSYTAKNLADLQKKSARKNRVPEIKSA